MEKYKLTNLPYGYKDLEPYMSEQVLMLHHDKHHASYVNSANELLDKIQTARDNGSELDYKSILKSLSFNVNGHLLHSVFWQIMAPANSGKNEPNNEILEAIKKEFGSFERFKSEFYETAKSVEGSGWAMLAYNKEQDNLLIAQIEKHNTNCYAMYKPLLLIDVWEHSYYLDYKNDRGKFIENWWNIINWQEVNKRFTT